MSILYTALEGKISIMHKRKVQSAFFIHRFCLLGLGILSCGKANGKHCSTQFHIRELSIWGFWYLWGPWNQPPVDIKGWLQAGDGEGGVYRVAILNEDGSWKISLRRSHFSKGTCSKGASTLRARGSQGRVLNTGGIWSHYLLFLSFIEFIEVTLVNKTIQVLLGWLMMWAVKEFTKRRKCME